MIASFRKSREQFFCAFCGLLLAAAGAAQDSAPPTQIKTRSELVPLYVSVADARGDFVGGLRKENFRVLDDDIEQRIAVYDSMDAPAHLLVLVETSPAVYLIHTQHLAAAASLLDGLAAGDEVALATYSQSTRLVLPMTSDKRLLARGLGSLEYSFGMGELNLYGSISTALDWLAPVAGKKALVLLSTGLNTGRAINWEGLAAKLRANDTTIYAVALGGELRSAKPRGKPGESQAESEVSFEQADRVLHAMADLTGGRAYFPNNVKDFPVIYRQIALTLRHQYLLAIEPAAHDGRYHSLEVQVRDASGRLLAPSEAKSAHHVFARPGYQSPVP